MIIYNYDVLVSFKLLPFDWGRRYDFSQRINHTDKLSKDKLTELMYHNLGFVLVNGFKRKVISKSIRIEKVNQSRSYK